MRPALRLLPLPLCIAFSLGAMAEERPEDWRLCPLEDAVPVFPDAPPPIGTSADREDMPTEIGGDALTGIYGEETRLRGNATLQRGDQFLATDGVEVEGNIPFYIMKSNGGVLSAEEVVNQPITTVLSGPAADIRQDEAVRRSYLGY